ncbi:MAG: amidohydrolase family protein, partial [Candidatus Njordarchaeota archaeon]
RKIIRLLSKNPAKIFSISKRGWIKIGNCADLVIFDPKRRWIIDPDFCLSKSRASPYDGMFVRGFVDAVFLRGNLVYENGYFIKKIGKHI